MLNYIKPERLWLKAHPSLSERWVQERLAEDPALLGLGELVLKDKERVQPRAGRLDLLFQEPDSNRRYEVELQLGPTDESHLIRTIEYWDIERKRYPQYDHTAVIVAEHITGRFLNIVGLFNGFIPLVAIQFQAVQVGGDVALVFTTVLDQMRLGLVEEDEEAVEVTDRGYWEKRASRETLDIMDRLLTWVTELDPSLSPKYNKFYVGLAESGRANNYLSFKPKKSWLWLEAKMPRSEELDSSLQEAGLEGTDYDPRRGRYVIRVTKTDLQSHEALLKTILASAHEYSGNS